MVIPFPGQGMKTPHVMAVAQGNLWRFFQAALLLCAETPFGKPASRKAPAKIRNVAGDAVKGLLGVPPG